MEEKSRGESRDELSGVLQRNPESGRGERLGLAVEAPPRRDREEREVWAKRCGWCGSLNPDRALYCIECGAAIESRVVALGTSRREMAGLATTSLPLNMVARSIYFAMGAGAYLLVAIGLMMVIPSWLQLPLLAVQLLGFVYLASVGRYGQSGFTRYLIMFIWAVIPIFDLIVIPYYVGKGLVAYAALDRSGLIRMARIPSGIGRRALSAVVPIVFIMVLAGFGAALLRYFGAEMPANRWGSWASWIADRWARIDFGGRAEWTKWVRDVFADAQALISGRR